MVFPRHCDELVVVAELKLKAFHRHCELRSTLNIGRFRKKNVVLDSPPPPSPSESSEDKQGPFASPVYFRSPILHSSLHFFFFVPSLMLMLKLQINCPRASQTHDAPFAINLPPFRPNMVLN